MKVNEEKIVVYTTTELEEAIKAGETKLLLKGEIAEMIRKRKARKKRTLIGGLALAAAGLVALPFTLGASTPLLIGGLGLTIGTVTISAAELAILVGGSIAIIGLCKDYTITFNSDGSVTLERKD